MTLEILGEDNRFGGKWACRWIGVKLKRIGKIPRVIITDGLSSYSHIICGQDVRAPRAALNIAKPFALFVDSCHS